MYTNLDSFGGKFIDKLNEEFAFSKCASIASGYISIDTILKFEIHLQRMAENGGVGRILIGMALYDGLKKKSIEALRNIDLDLRNISDQSGIFISTKRPYHGKVYEFVNIETNDSNIYVGSSNFSNSGTWGNIECTISVKEHKRKVQDFIHTLFTSEYSTPIGKTNITAQNSPKYQKNLEFDKLSKLKRYNPRKINIKDLPSFTFPLSRIVEMQHSNLNIYFGKGRLNTNTGIVSPRAWYEIELIADRNINSNPLYPQGDFLAYTDDGYIIPMRTQGDYLKNIRSRDSLQIFGMWLKGKLQRTGSLLPLTPVTKDTLDDYGKEIITFYKIAEGEYYMIF